MDKAGDLSICGNPFKSECDENQWNNVFSREDRLIIRKSLRCDCDGVSRKEKSIETDHGIGQAALYQWNNVVKQFSKSECGMCPWSFYKTDPLIKAVFRQKTKGIISPNLILEDSLDNPVYEAVLVFYTYLENCKQELRLREDQEREQKMRQAEMEK